jgi:hypothetical protein
MPPAHLRFGGGSADSAINPIVAVYLLIAVVLILTLPRRSAVAAFLIPFFTVALGEVIVIGGFHFTALRLLILAGLARRVRIGEGLSKGKFPGGFGAIDGAVVLWSILAVIDLILQFPQMQAIIYAVGTLLDTLGAFLVVRSLITDTEDVRYAIKTLAILCLILGICMISEYVSHVNVFGVLGGISREVAMREGKARASGSMGYLYAGAFSGVLIPLFVWLWKEKKCRNVAVVGLLGAMAMVITSNSSTSLMAVAGAIVGLAFWPLRKQMRLVRWSLVAVLVGLNMVMKAPVWALIARVDLTGSSSSYQRYILVNEAVQHFKDWWLIGTPNYIRWGWDSWDLCNQFVAVALTGGLLPLIFYIAIFSRAFAAIGNARKRIRGNRRQEWFLWCLGSTLFATVVASFGINYTQHLIVGLFCLISCIAVITFDTLRVRATRGLEPAHAQIPATAWPPGTAARSRAEPQVDAVISGVAGQLDT